MIAHVGFVSDGQPFVIPLSYHYHPSEPEHLYLHGSVKSRILDHLANGAPVCVTVTLVDGLVYSRKAMNHSMNYRSVVLLGQADAVTDRSEKMELFDQIVRRYFPGRSAGPDYNLPPPADLDATDLVKVKIKEWNAKARRGGPTGPDDTDLEAPGTAGIIELREVGTRCGV